MEHEEKTKEGGPGIGASSKEARERERGREGRERPFAANGRIDSQRGRKVRSRAFLFFLSCEPAR